MSTDQNPSRGQSLQPYRWQCVTERAAFAPRDGAGALIHQDRMWLLGGWNPSDKEHFPRVCNNEVWSSDNGENWTLEKPNTFLDDTFEDGGDWAGRHTAGYAVHRDRMWIVGGDPIQGNYQDDVWCSANGVDWECVNRDVPWGPRVLHYTVVHDDKIWIIGGQSLPGFAPAEEMFYADVWCSEDGVDWQQIIPVGPRWHPRGMIGGSAVLDDRIWLLGGGTYDTPDTPLRKIYNDVWSTADGIHWEYHLQPAPWHARLYHEVAVFDNRMWVLEGSRNRDGYNQNDVWYSADGLTWDELPDTPWKPRHAASVFVYHNALWMVAGNNMESDVWKLVKRS